jgi:membrane protease YdiL (CAAX protease family)
MHEKSVPQQPESNEPESPLVPEPRKRSLGEKIFLGPYGLRAGWRLLIYLLIGAVVLFALGALVRHLFYAPRGVFRARVVLANETGLFLAALIPALVMARIEKRSLADYGLPLRGALGKNFWIGMLWGVLAISALILAIHGAHAFDYGGLALRGSRIIKWAVFWGVFFLVVGLFEEFFLRGYTLFTLSTGIGFWPAAGVLSFLFGAIHLGNPNEEWIGGVSAGLIGLFFCLTLRRTGDLWFAIGMHLSFDWGETFLYSVPNSGFAAPGHLLNSTFHGPRWLTGGSIGPEGSVFVFVMIGVLFVVFDRMYREVKYPRNTVAVHARSFAG